MPSSRGSLTGEFTGTIHFDWAPEPIMITDQLDAAATALDNMVPPLEGSRAIAQEDIRNHFVTKTGPDGEPWPEWSELYAARQEGGSLLVQTGELEAAATADSSFHINVFAGGGELFFDADLPHYGMAHHTGLLDRKTKWGTPNVLPARPFLGVSENAELGMVEVFDVWVASIADGFGDGVYVHEGSSSHWVQQRLPNGRWGKRIG